MKQKMELPHPTFDKPSKGHAASKYSGTAASQHGGMWTDLDNAKEILASKLELGLINDEQAEHLANFIDNGYVILNKLIPDDLIDSFLADQELIKQGRVDGHYVEYIDQGQHFHGKPFTPDLIGKSFKLIDVYAQSESARKINLNQKITEFLGLIFEQPALAFQSLSFFTGSGQSIHQDTTYVRVSSPLELVATWVALEDVVEGSGELEFFSGSHKLPDFNFPGNPGSTNWFENGKSKWFDRKNFEVHSQYVKWLSSESEQRGLQRKKFIAKKGDVLFWTNDFAHGGAPVTKPNHSRLSLVTHYCPVNVNPYYFYTRFHAPKIQYSDTCSYTFVDHESKPIPLKFDDEQYLQLHPDVKAANLNAKFHYSYFGKNENRAIK
jgi:phytanoyl-CoA hydroxylase